MPAMTPGEYLRHLRTKRPLIPAGVVANVFGWTKDVLRAIEADEIKLVGKGGELTESGPREVGYQFIAQVLEALRNGETLPQVSRRAHKPGRALVLPSGQEDGEG